MIDKWDLLNIALTIKTSNKSYLNKIGLIIGDENLSNTEKKGLLNNAKKNPNILKNYQSKSYLYTTFPSFYTKNGKLRKTIDFNDQNAITYNKVNLNTAVVLIGRDPNKRVAPRIYSENSIKTWLKTNPTDPLTRAPVSHYVKLPDELKKAYMKNNT